MGLIHMQDILPLIGVPLPPPGRSSYNIPCPCCDENPRKRHLNINLKKDVFRCPRCGFSGGVFDLYAHYEGIPRAAVRDALLTRLDVRGNIEHYRPSRDREPVTEECPLTDIDSRNATYQALLSQLTLASDHRANLLSRGLSPDEIERLNYKTTPVIGMSTIAKKLLAEGHYLTGVPGFYRKAGEWTFISEWRGILIPVRDIQGRIQGLQIRRDNVTRRKFRWVSSVEEPDGCKAESWAHLAGTPQEMVILTEGPMKADIIHALTGKTIIAIAGVNALSQLERMLLQLRQSGTKKIMTAFDMDFLSNPHVERGYENLTKMLTTMGFSYGTYIWDPTYKGLDDYVWQYCLGNGSAK